MGATRKYSKTSQLIVSNIISYHDLLGRKDMTTSGYLCPSPVVPSIDQGAHPVSRTRPFPHPSGKSPHDTEKRHPRMEIAMKKNANTYWCLEMQVARTTVRVYII